MIQYYIKETVKNPSRSYYLIEKNKCSDLVNRQYAKVMQISVAFPILTCCQINQENIPFSD